MESSKLIKVISKLHTNLASFYLNSNARFSNALVFKDMDDTDIKNIETWIRTKTLNKLKEEFNNSINQNNSDCEPLIDDGKMREYFGEAYANDPENFEFLPGDIKLIKYLVAHVKNLVDGKGKNKGLKLFQPKNAPSVSISKRMPITQNQQQPTEESPNEEIEDQILVVLKSTLFGKIMECMQLYKVNELVDLENVNESIVTIHRNGTQIYGEVYCVLCQSVPETKDTQPKRVSYSSTKNSKFWVTSNFVTHLKRYHKLSAPSTAPKKTSKSVNGKKKSELSTTDFMVSQDDIQNASVIIIETQQPNGEHYADDWYQQISRQITLMSQSVLANGDNQTNVNVKLNDTDAIKIKVVRSPSDGNCLFRSLAHQLYAHGMNTEQLNKECTDLRATVVEHIRQNAKSFEHEIKGRVYDNIDNRCQSTADIDIVAECSFFTSGLLSRDKYWGGAETLKAVSEIYGVNIIVFYEEEKYQVVSKNFDKTICVAFRLRASSKSSVIRNHYDSVTDIDANDIYTLTQT